MTAANTGRRDTSSGLRHWLSHGVPELAPGCAPPPQEAGPPTVPLASAPIPCERPPTVPRPEDARAQLLAAKALVFCGFPYKRTPQTTIVREARVGAESHLTVYFSTTKLGVPIPYGADRALLAWITTLAYQTGWVSFDSLTSFFDAFHLGRSGAEYRRFSQRLERLLSLSLTFVLRTPEGERHSNMPPLNDAFTPRDGTEARRLLVAEHAPQLTFLESDIRRYGIVLNPKFHAYLRENHVRLPLPLMRRFHSRPLFWDFASFLLYRCYAARQSGRVAWRLVRRQLASVDGHDRRLAQTLNKVADEIRLEYKDFPAKVEHHTHDLLVAPWRPPVEQPTPQDAGLGSPPPPQNGRYLWDGRSR